MLGDPRSRGRGSFHSAVIFALAWMRALRFDRPPSSQSGEFPILSLFDFRPDWHSAALLAIAALLVLLRFRLLKSPRFKGHPLLGYALAGGLAVLAVLVMIHQGS